MIHYIVPASLNDSQKSIRPKRNAVRKHPMHLLNLTFDQLKQKMAETINVQQSSNQTHSNLLSALNAFMHHQGVKDESSISSNLRASIYKNRDAHISLLKEQGKSASYIANRKTYITRWHLLLLKLDRECALTAGRASPFVMALREFTSDISQAELAQQSGISLATFKRWLKGATPNERARPSLFRLERFLGITSGQLLGLAGLDERLNEKIAMEKPPIVGYRELLKKTTADTYILKEAGTNLRSEWLAFMQYKTAHTVFSKSRQKNGRWSMTTEAVIEPNQKNWHSFQGKNYVATAGITWQVISSYLGWLHIPTARGGVGLSLEEVQTLAHLTNCNYLEQYISWRIERTEQKINSGIILFLQIIKSVCHPVTGYLRNTPTICKSISVDEAVWATRCDRAFEFSKEHRSALSKQQEPSRNPFEPLKSLLALENPLEGIADAIQRLNAARPSTGGVKEAIWARDRLLLKLLASNPLRAKNLKMLKICCEKDEVILSGEDTGKIYQHRDGTWRICIPKKIFKNFAGAAKERDYDMPVQGSVGRDIEQYLKYYRPLITSTNNPYLFTSSKNNDTRMMYGLNRRVENLTRKYVWRCPGFGPHGFRHIVATSILKMSPNDWQTAALVLHDREDTVRAHYAHLRSNDGAVRQSEILGSSYSRM